MTSSILIFLGVLSLTLTAAIVFSRRSAIACVATSLFALGFAAFCAFGFLASFELSNSSDWPWQLAYATMGIGSLVASFLGLKGAWNLKLAERTS